MGELTEVCAVAVAILCVGYLFGLGFFMAYLQVVGL